VSCNTAFKIPAQRLRFHHTTAAQDFAYTMAAARRSEQRRLLNYIRMSDFMVADTLHTILVESVREVLAAAQPAAASTSAFLRNITLQKSHTLKSRAASINARSELAASGPLAAITARPPGSATAATPPRTPLFEIDVVLYEGLPADELVFTPLPDEFQVQTGDV
jgi:dynein heavy chain